MAASISDLRTISYQDSRWRLDVMDWAYGTALRPNPYVDELVRQGVIVIGRSAIREAESAATALARAGDRRTLRADRSDLTARSGFCGSSAPHGTAVGWPFRLVRMDDLAEDRGQGDGWPASDLHAAINYTLFIDGRRVGPSDPGESVRQDDTRKVSFRTVCSLAQYGTDVPQAATC
ncbi:hypothetical protein ACIBBB_17335 [Streptomyces sp. NPDC051217]|uniref:hypothetical protein n=1 Tax=Streptomyces sp. NPDC051217 TaxID=3365644 RepID=UPI0037A8CCCF